jgi:hypothetical protein
MATNDITGDSLRSRVVSDEYRDNYDEIFGRNPLDELYTQADEQLDTYGMVDVDLLSQIVAEGGDTSKYC